MKGVRRHPELIASTPVDRALWERRALTKADHDWARHLAELRNNNAIRLDTRHINNFRPDAIGGFVDGYLGEFAVADSLGLSRVPDVSGRADPGYDIELPGGETIQVRFTPNMTGRLMVPANKPVRATWMVLVVAESPCPTEAWIVGGLSTREFYAREHLYDWGHGPTRYLVQDEILPWEYLKPLLESRT